MANITFICNECGTKYPKWIGKCTACNTWDSVTEDKQIEDDKVFDNSFHWSGQSLEIINLAKVTGTILVYHA